MMKVLQANNLNQALKEIKEIDENLIESLNENIKECDKNHYHVILVRVKTRPGQAKNEVSFIVQTYNSKAYNKIKKNYIQQGFSGIVLLHDPRQNKTEEDSNDVDVDSQEYEKTKTIEDQAKQIKELQEKLVDKEKKSVPVAPVQEPVNQEPIAPVQEPIEKKEFDVNTANFKELNIYAAENNIDLEGKRSTEDIRAIIISKLPETK